MGYCLSATCKLVQLNRLQVSSDSFLRAACCWVGSQLPYFYSQFLFTSPRSLPGALLLARARSAVLPCSRGFFSATSRKQSTKRGDTMQSSRTVSASKLVKHLTAGVFLAVLCSASHAGSVAYTYDSLGRLSKATYANGVVITYVYDAAGNRTSYTVVGAPS